MDDPGSGFERMSRWHQVAKRLEESDHPVDRTLAAIARAIAVHLADRLAPRFHVPPAMTDEAL
jgi:hypothetical protein